MTPNRSVRDIRNQKWFVYILQCGDKTLYTGSTNDLPKRIFCHGTGKGAKYTRSRLPVKLIHKEKAADRSSALKREIQIKKMRRAEKLDLIRRSKTN